jgi:superfamily II DNA helicase RecQ
MCAEEYLCCSAPLPVLVPKEVDGDALSSLYDQKSTDRLRILLRDQNATFRSPAQYRVYCEIMRRQRHCLYVASCGAGKTLPFMLAAMSWGITKQSILVLPYQILHPEMHRRLSKSNISNCKWTMEHPSPGEQVVTVAIESFSNNVFVNWLAGVANNGRLGCIMFDEAHGIVEDQQFRPAYLDAIRKLMQLQNAPILFTSSTMAWGFTGEFWKAADLLYRPDQSAIVIRTRTQ